jgi:hypothetical protein
MTAAEILRNAEPPADDGLIDKAIAELDVRIWEWADALKSAHTQLRGAFATKPARPSARLFDDTTAPPASLSAAAAAAHIPSPPPMPAEWTASPSQAPAGSGAASRPNMPAEAAWSPSHGGHGLSAQPSGQPAAPAWPEPHSFRQEGGAPPPSQSTKGGVLEWPTTPSGGGGGTAWPTSSTATSGVQEWPTWTPNDGSKPDSAKKTVSSAPQKKGPKQARPVPEGPSPEERAQKAAAEEALLSELEDAIARRVRLLRRLDPDTPIEKLIDKARQGQAEAATAPQAKEDKSSSWWRRK